MDLFLVFTCVYFIYICFDLIPHIQKKEKKILFFSVPVYLFTIVINFMIAMGIRLPTLNLALKQLISSIFHMQ